MVEYKTMMKISKTKKNKRHFFSKKRIQTIYEKNTFFPEDLNKYQFIYILPEKLILTWAKYFQLSVVSLYKIR